jgi:branched-chain amino acid transport system substrate-binding protein
VRCVALAVLAVVAVAVAGCGSAPSTRVTSSTLSIYTSLPLRGDRAAESHAILRGEKLALNEVGGEVGGKTIGFVALDDTVPEGKRWAPEQAASNAKAAASNPTTVAYIGDVDSGATSVSLPLTNEAGILHVSPLSGYTGLTRTSDKGEPAKYYPTQQRTFARLTPNGIVEAHALVAWLKQVGAEKLAIVADEHQDGQGTVRDLSRALAKGRLDVVDDVRVSQRREDVSGPVRELAKLHPEAVIYAGASPEAAARLLRAAHAELPKVRLIATSAAAQSSLPRLLGSAAPAVRVMSPVLPARHDNAHARRMQRSYRRLYGESAPPVALYGYEAMRSVLQAIKDAGARSGEREVVIAKYFDGRQRRSVLGSYRIGRRGDTTLDQYGLYGVVGRNLELQGILRGGPG